MIPPAKKPDPYELVVRFRLDSHIVSDQGARAVTANVLTAATTAFGAKISTYTLRQGGKIIDISNLSPDKGLEVIFEDTNRRIEQVNDISLEVAKIDEELSADIDARRQADAKLQEELEEAYSAISGQ